MQTIAALGPLLGGNEAFHAGLDAMALNTTDATVGCGLKLLLKKLKEDEFVSGAGPAGEFAE